MRQLRRANATVEMMTADRPAVSCTQKLGPGEHTSRCLAIADDDGIETLPAILPLPATLRADGISFDLGTKIDRRQFDKARRASWRGRGTELTATRAWRQLRFSRLRDGAETLRS